MKKLVFKKGFTLLLLSAFLLIFCVVYKNVDNSITNIMNNTSIFGLDENSQEVFESVVNIMQNPIVQFIFRFIGEMISLFFGSLIVLLFIKIGNLFSQIKADIKIKDIISAFFLGLYVNMFNYFIQILFMLIFWKSLDLNVDIFLFLYQILIMIMHAGVIIYIIKKRHNILWPTVCYFAITLLIQLFNLKNLLNA